MITSGTTKFEKKEEKSFTPYTPKIAVFAENSQKKYVFPTLGGKNPNFVLINVQKSVFRFLSQ